MKTVAVIPAYMEEESIGHVVSEAAKHVDEVIVVDDGSKDKTAEKARAAGATVISHPCNKGYGAAIQTSFDAARKQKADVLVILDADRQHDPDSIPKFIEAVNKGYDVVIGSRFMQIEKNDIPAYRKFGINILNRLTNYLSSGEYDTQSGFRAYSRKAVELLDLEEDGTGISSEIIMKAGEIGLSIGQIPINVRYDTRKPIKNPLAHGASVVISLIRLVAQKHPLSYFGVIGLLMFTGGIASALFVINRYNDSGILAIGTALLAAVLILLGMILVTTAITLYVIQDTIKRTFREQEMKRRMNEIERK